MAYQRTLCVRSFPECLNAGPALVELRISFNAQPDVNMTEHNSKPINFCFTSRIQIEKFDLLQKRFFKPFNRSLRRTARIVEQITGHVTTHRRVIVPTL